MNTFNPKDWASYYVNVLLHVLFNFYFSIKMSFYLFLNKGKFRISYLLQFLKACGNLCQPNLQVPPGTTHSLIYYKKLK